VVDWIESKPVWVFLPSGADELIGSKPLESFEALGEVVGHEAGLEVLFQVLMSLVVERVS